jgi:hypothetical protein
MIHAVHTLTSNKVYHVIQSFVNAASLIKILIFGILPKMG